MFDQRQQAIGILQHHDAVTGTAKQAVQDDYNRIAHSAIHDSALKTIKEIVDELLGSDI